MSTNFGNMNFHENPSRGSRAVPWRQTDRQTDKTKLASTFRNCLAKALIQLDDEISTHHVGNDCGFMRPYSAQTVPHTECIW